MTVSISVDWSALDDMLDELGDAAEAAARPAAQAAAQVLYKQVLHNVASIGQVSGNLGRSIYQVYSHDNSALGRAVYHISWNHRKAPHGHLVEFGHIQRYVAYVGKDGNWYTAVRPSMRGKRRPTRKASQAVKDAYYVTLPAPRQVPARSFIRAAGARLPDALDAARVELLRRIA